MLIHLMEVHGDSMIPPKFKFERVASYKDIFTRQISEALLIETEGTLNKRQEYGCNNLFRLESGKAEWEKERYYELEARQRANLYSNLRNFTNVIESVVNRCNELSNPVDHCHISREKHN